MRLTNLQCKALRPKQKPYKVFDGKSLYLHIMPDNRKYWRYKYHFLRKEKLLAFGAYPEVSLQEARTKLDDARKLLKQGKDPSMERKKAKLKIQSDYDNNFKTLAYEWHANHKISLTKRTADGNIKRLQDNIFPLIGDFPITEITPPMLLHVLQKVADRGAIETAKKLLQHCRKIFQYAIITGRLRYNPANDLTGVLPASQKGHFNAINYRELPDFLKALRAEDARLELRTRYAVELLMLTFVRTSELIEAKWHEVNFDDAVWQIPAERMKMRRPHIVPLSRQALEILHALKKQHLPNTEFIFPNRTYPRKTMSNNTILGVIKRIGYQGKMTGHGFRALAMSTLKEKLNYRHEVIDRQLAHAARNKIIAAYDRAEFLDERAKMMQEWADYIDSVLS